MNKPLLVNATGNLINVNENQRSNSMNELKTHVVSLKLTGRSLLCLFHGDSLVGFIISWLELIRKRCRVFQSLHDPKVGKQFLT